MRHPLTSAEQRLGEQMDRYWAAFARTGNPNVPGQVAWPAVTPGAHPVLDFHPTGNPPKPSKAGPGRSKGRRGTPAPRHNVIKKAA
jgi:carboxylesterase type B